MKFFLDNWYLFAAALASGALLLWPSLRPGARAGVSAAEVVNLINRQKGVLIDIQAPADFAAGHASGARNVPFDKLETAADLPKNKGIPLVVVCANGVRASRAIEVLKKRGHSDVRALGGGLRAWREANLPIEKSA